MVTEHDLPRLFSPDREAENPKDRVGDTKPPLHLIPPSAEILEAVVMGLGARKYGQTLNTRTHHGLGHHAPSDLLRCSQCGDSKSSTEFNRDHRRPHNRRAECRVCQSRYNRELKARKPLYNIWNLMQQRCYNKDNPGYEFYGARGIVVCDRWHTYEAFVEDMSPRPSAKHSIDRMDVNGIYSPENCRWATQQEQVLNLRSNRLI